jgi:hypothetical protein
MWVITYLEHGYHGNQGRHGHGCSPDRCQGAGKRDEDHTARRQTKSVGLQVGPNQANQILSAVGSFESKFRASGLFELKDTVRLI